MLSHFDLKRYFVLSNIAAAFSIIDSKAFDLCRDVC